MKSFAQFFPKKPTETFEYKIKCHIDGISINGLGSMRVSNISKNLQSLVSTMVTMGKNLPTFLLSACNFLAYKTQALDCNLYPYGISSVYLSSAENNNFILVQHREGNSLTQSLNNTCGFFTGTKQSGTYTIMGCFCISSSVAYNTARVALSAQNITNEQLVCMNNFLAAYCTPPPLSTAEKIALGVMIPGIVCLGLCCIFICASRKKPEAENVALLDTESSEPTRSQFRF